MKFNRFSFITTHEKYTDALSATINKIISPDDPGYTGNIIIYTYNSLTKSMISRTYHTLNPCSLSYISNGTEISVNNGEPISLELGSYSDLITISIPSACTQELTLTPTT